MVHKHKKPELVPLRRTKEPLGFYTLTVCLQTSLPPPPMSSVLKVSLSVHSSVWCHWSS